MLPLTLAMDLRGVKVPSVAVMSMSWSCWLSSAESAPRLMLVSGNKPATAVSVFPAVDVLLTCQDSGSIF
jgi:hypothetical protein